MKRFGMTCMLKDESGVIENYDAFYDDSKQIRIGVKILY